MLPWGKSWGNKGMFGKVRSVGKGIHAELSLLARLKQEWKGSISHANSLKQKPCLAIVSTRNRSSSSPEVLLWQFKTSRTSEVYNVAWLLPCNQMPLIVLRYINFSVSLSQVRLSQKLYWKLSTSRKEGFY